MLSQPSCHPNADEYFHRPIFLAAAPRPIDVKGLPPSSEDMNITNRRHQEFTVLTGNRRRAGDRIGRTYPTGRTTTGLSAVGMTAKAIEPHEAELLVRRPPLVQA